DVLVTGLRPVGGRDALLLLGYEGPNLVALYEGGVDVADQAVMEPRARLPGRDAEAHDGVSVNASQSLRRADARTLDQGGDDAEAALEGEDVHACSPNVATLRPRGKTLPVLPVCCYIVPHASQPQTQRTAPRADHPP